MQPGRLVDKVHGSKVQRLISSEHDHEINNKGKNAKRLTLNFEPGTFRLRPTGFPIFGQFRHLPRDYIRFYLMNNKVCSLYIASPFAEEKKGARIYHQKNSIHYYDDICGRHHPLLYFSRHARRPHGPGDQSGAG
jgi:hypothetical protein